MTSASDRVRRCAPATPHHGLLLALVVCSAVTGACATEPATAMRAYLDSGDRYLAEGRLAEAIIELLGDEARRLRLVEAGLFDRPADRLGEAAQALRRSFDSLSR